MKLLANIMTGFVALSHIGFMILEMFFWDHPVGEKVFQLPRDVLASSAKLAANQGLYNGFLAAGLIWALATDQTNVKRFFLGCVIVAGVFGAATTSKGSLVLTQSLPALIALVLVMLSSKKAVSAIKT